MLYKELEDCEQCPLYIHEVCPGGATSGPGGYPIEPPCTCFDGEDDLDEECQRIIENGIRMEEQMDAQFKAEKLKAEKNAQAAAKRREALSEVRAETRAISSIKKRISANEAVARLASTMQMVSEMMGERRQTEDIKRGRTVSLEEENKKLWEEIARLEEVKKTKLADLRKRRREQGK